MAPSPPSLIRRSARLATLANSAPVRAPVRTPGPSRPRSRQRELEMEALTTLFTNIQDQLGSATSKIQRLNEHNYVTWKRDMTLSLQDAGLWDVVTTPPAHVPPVLPTPEWTRTNRHALAKIHESCEAPQQSLFAHIESAYLAWEKLRKIFETRDSLSLQRFYNDFNTIQKSDSETMLAYVARIKAAAACLNTAGEAVTTPNLHNRIITGLGPRYRALRFYLEMDANLTEDRLVQLLLAEEARPRSDQSSRGTEQRSRRYRSRSRDRRRSPARRRSPDLGPLGLLYTAMTAPLQLRLLLAGPFRHRPLPLPVFLLALTSNPRFSAVGSLIVALLTTLPICANCYLTTRTVSMRRF